MSVAEDGEVLESLKRALELVRTVEWARWNPRRNRAYCTVYWFAHHGWEANDFLGPYWPMIHALRRHVEDGDLTWWWHHGRNREEMVRLFKAAIADVEMAQGRVAA